MEFLAKHPAIVPSAALLAIGGLWLWYRWWVKSGRRDVARMKAIARIPDPPPSTLNYEQLRDKIHREFVARCRRRMGAIPPDSPERAEYAQDVRRVIEHLIDTENPILNRIEREMLITDVAALLGFGPPRQRTPAPSEGVVHLKVPRRSES